MRELPFGARISDSFVEKLKRETAKANEEWPGVFPCLCGEERQRYETVGKNQQVKPVDLFERAPEIPPVNRLVPPPPPRAMLIKERVWVLYFEKCEHSAEAAFDIDGIELHISKWAQAQLKGATVSVVGDKVVVTYEPI